MTCPWAVSLGRCPKGFPADPFKAARRRLVALDAATSLDDPKDPTSNRSHAVERDRAGQHATAVSDPFRICFVWTASGPERVGFAVDHRGLAMPDAAVTLDTLRETFDEGDPVTVLPPVHPGEILREAFMAPLGLTAGTVSHALHLPRSLIARIVGQEIGISTDTALRLARYAPRTCSGSTCRPGSRARRWPRRSGPTWSGSSP